MVGLMQIVGIILVVVFSLLIYIELRKFKEWKRPDNLRNNVVELSQVRQNVLREMGRKQCSRR